MDGAVELYMDDVVRRMNALANGVLEHQRGARRPLMSIYCRDRVVLQEDVARPIHLEIRKRIIGCGENIVNDDHRQG